ncbi:hypothetical protein JW752_03490, partial [Candidatus Peregrinibacteria bacterium]|nr:hypothetical protein [Candidatus Peregrinibacteria bacterium]
EHFSPELCDIIRTKINEYEKAPEGWMTNTRLSSELEVDFRTVKVRADTFRDTHPEWFMDYKDVVGKLREHYSPELCDILKKELDK